MRVIHSLVDDREKDSSAGVKTKEKYQLVDHGLASPSLLGKQTGPARGKGAGPGRQRLPPAKARGNGPCTYIRTFLDWDAGSISRGFEKERLGYFVCTILQRPRCRQAHVMRVVKA